MYPRSGFRSGGTSAKTTLLENHPFGNPLFLVLFGDFPDFAGIFPICPRFVRGFSRLVDPCPLSRPIDSTHEEQSRKGPQHNPDLFRKNGNPPGLEPPRFTFSQGIPPPPPSVLKRCVPKTLAFVFGLRLRPKMLCFKTRVLGRTLPNGKTQESLRLRVLRSKTLASKKRIFCDLKTALGARACV